MSGPIGSSGAGGREDSVEGVLDNQDRLARKIEDAVRLMFVRLSGGAMTATRTRVTKRS